MQVEWKIKGIFKANAEQVYKEITALGESFTPEDIVEAAKDTDSELHKCFEWDDTKAAKKYREHQARILSCSLVVKVETKEAGPTSIRMIQSTEKKNEYKPTVMVIKNRDEYAAILARAKRELQAFREKYKTVKELREIFDMIDGL